MKLEKLQYFIDLVNSGSFTKTGQMNHIAQTSISQQVHSLEDHFNTKLIDRNVNPVRPTKAGRLLYQEAQKVVQQYAKLEQTMSDFQTGQNRIRIEYTSLIDLDFLVSLTKKLQNQTNLLFELEKQPQKEIAANLRNGQFDLAISFDSEFSNEKLLQTVTLYEGTYCGLVGKNHPLFNQSFITNKQLYDYPLVMLSPNAIGKSYQLMLTHAKQDGYLPNIAQTVNDIETEFFLLRTQNLIGFFPNNYPLPENHHDLHLLPIKDTNHKFKIVFAYRKDFNQTALIRAISAIKL
ncbi:LysR family transcriptional regulator [Lactobacillus sp. ESL0684]|uniref:LysR family transcriptional regulator n=1 Tax=unclassified Lactobacillus TaxID=2620435 RepID=UPI0023F88FD2|nr:MULTISPECIES: LysR family transcriptional regulator [unclassified Lactobacillus]WEV40924.1 LysR family transcriptional regulator [Lactobacillus sp. ESL0681]WEV44243.1 LysR family transcriptional regulator [Lactobacillus sp. ESL0684]